MRQNAVQEHFACTNVTGKPGAEPLRDLGKETLHSLRRRLFFCAQYKFCMTYPPEKSIIYLLKILYMRKILKVKSKLPKIKRHFTAFWV
jgi:hypothetical protein